MHLKKIEITDAEALASAFERYKGRICDYSLGNAIFWRDYYDISFYLGDDGIVLCFGNMDGVKCYSYPISDDPDALIRKLIEFERANGEDTLCLTCLTKAEYEHVSEHYSVLQVMHNADWDDYLYNAKDIVTLKGRKYNTQRNHINKFKKCYPDAYFEVITAQNAHIAKDFCQRYFNVFGKVTDVSHIEEKQLYEQFDNWEDYLQLGGILFANGEAVGISVGEQVGDTLIIHTEKANIAYDGVYPALTNRFARQFADNEGCRFINREEDCGEEGLRKAKRSYHPVEMVEKYAVRVKGDVL